MADELEQFHAIRKPGAHLEEGVVADDFVLMLGVDLNNYPKFPRVDDAVWESMGRPDILEKDCHSTCPKSMIVTTKMYNPNMKVDILAIPPRVEDGNVCCKWQFSMRDESDPEYVPVELSAKR